MIIKRLTSLFLLLFLLLSLEWKSAPSTAFAQSKANRWGTPQNISRAGESLNPILGADSNGDLHVFWSDPRIGVYYSFTTQDGWSLPRKTSFPIPREVMNSNLAFQHASPRLVRSIGTRMYLFWKDENFLVFNIGNVGSAEKLSSWMPTRLIARFVTHYDVQVDSEGIIHLTYLQAEDYANTPAGVYYTRSADFGGTWSSPILIYASNYYRSLPPVIRSGLEPPQPITNSLDLSVAQAGEQKIIYLAFDQQPRKKVWIAQSLDGGVTWNPPIEIDSANSAGGIAYPENIHVASLNQKAVLIWQLRQSETVCFTYFKQSEDAGQTWSANQRLNTPFLTCSERIEILENSNSFPIITFYTQKLLYFATWNGTEWSDIYNEPHALSFMDSETSSSISLSLAGMILRGAQQIALAGVDINANQDIWVHTGNFEDISSWLPQNPGWKPPQILQKTDSPISNLQIIEDQQKQWHAFWLQDEILEIPPGTLVKPESRRIAYYSYLEGNRWSLPISILKPSSGTNISQNSDEEINNLSVTVDGENRFFAIWQNKTGGEVYFSWSMGNTPLSALDWSPPSLIYSIPNEATDLSIKIAPDYSIKVIYAIPINENRGVYLVESRDQGKSWSNPTVIVNGSSQKWDWVTKPILVFSADGNFHVSVIHQSLLEGNAEKGLFETHSFDRGMTWTEPEKISSKVILWNTFLASGNTLHRIWAEKSSSENRTLLLHQFSQDNGRSWERITRITEWNGFSPSIQAAADEAGQIHLVYLNTQPLGNKNLRYLVWNRSGWDEIDSLDFGIIPESRNEIPLDVKIRKDGFMGVLLGLNLYDPGQKTNMITLLGSYRKVEIPLNAILPAVTPLPQASPAPTFIPMASPTPAPIWTPTLPVKTLPSDTEGSASSLMSNKVFLVAGGVMSGILVLVVVGITGVRRLKKRNPRNK